MFQVNQLASFVHSEFSISPINTGILCLLIIGFVILGDIKRVGMTAARIVPFMFIIYLISSFVVIIININEVPKVLGDIFSSAFGMNAISGGATGLIFKEVLVTGIKRAIFSNEAGVGTEAMAHGAAKTKEPVREGLVAMLGPFIDTHIVCTCTALVILTSGISTSESGIIATAMSFNQALPNIGNMIVYLVFSLFAISTMITYSYYSLKCARYLFGKKIGDFQIIQSKIGDMAVKIDAAALLVFRSAWVKDIQGIRVTRESSMAKLYATESAQEIIDEAVQIFGGMGVVSGVVVERLYREIRALRIYEGTSEIQKLVIAGQAMAE